MKPNKNILKAALAASILLTANPTFAQDDEEDADETLVIIANKVPTPLSQTGSSVTVLDENAILSSQEIGIFDLLRSVPGITVSRNGGLGSVSTVRIRGAESGQTLVLIDGIKANDLSSTSGEFNFASLTTDNIERIEVLRGPQSTLYGSDAVGGVINIITKKAGAGFQASGLLEGGSFGTFRGNANVGYNEDILSVNLSVSGTRTGGISAADVANGNTERDPFHTYGVIGNISVRASDNLVFDGFVRHQDSESAFDDFDFVADTFVDGDGVSESRNFQGAIGATWQGFDGKLEAQARSSWSHNDRGSFELGVPSFISQSQNRTVDLLATVRPSDPVTVLVGAQFQDTQITTEVFGDFASFLTGEADISSVFTEVTVRHVDNLTLTGGVRHDDHELFGGATTFRVTGVYKIPNTDTLLRANWGQGFKAPTLFQLFSAFGDPTLQPEESNGWEFGAEQKLAGGDVTLGVTYFYRKARNQIDFNSATFLFSNLLSTRAKGIEVVFAAKPFAFMTVDANYTRINSIDRSTGLVLLRRPKNIFNANIAITPVRTVSLAVGINHTGTQRDTAAFIDPYTVVDIRGSVALNESITLFARIENALDENYQEVTGFGTPGISGFAGLRGNF